MYEARPGKVARGELALTTGRRRMTMMGRARFENRDRRHYRGRFPDVGISDGAGEGGWP